MKKTTRIRLLAAGLLAVLLSGCGTDSVTGRQEMTADGGDAIEVGTDPHSHAEFEKVRIHHMRLDLPADMTGTPWQVTSFLIWNALTLHTTGWFWIPGTWTLRMSLPSRPAATLFR